MQLSKLKNLYEARDQNDNKLYKYCTFEWILDLLKDGEVFSYNSSEKKQKKAISDDGKTTEWIALTTKRSSSINQYLEEYGTCEISFDKEVMKNSNEIFVVSFNASWLDKRPSITNFITKGKYTSSKDYFLKNFKDVNWTNTDNFSKKFFKEYLTKKGINAVYLLSEYSVSEIEDYIYDTNYTPYNNYVSSIGNDDELVLINAPLKLVNDGVLQLVIPRRYKDKISKYESEYKIRYE